LWYIKDVEYEASVQYKHKRGDKNIKETLAGADSPSFIINDDLIIPLI